MNDVIKTIQPSEEEDHQEKDQHYFDYLLLNQPDNIKILIAVDTSGSTKLQITELADFLVSAIIDDDEVVTFSTFVTPYAGEGSAISEGGTDYSCVYEYAKGKGFDQIWVITDGWAKFYDEAPSAKKLKKKWHWFTPPYPLVSTTLSDSDRVDDVRITENIHPVVYTLSGGSLW